MYEVMIVLDDYDYDIKTFNLLSSAEEYYDSIADTMEYEGCSIGVVVMYHNNKKIKEFKAPSRIRYV